MIEPPVRLCCGQRHLGVVCPDGLVMCCQCFERFTTEQLNMTPEGLEDVCKPCAERETWIMQHLCHGRCGQPCPPHQWGCRSCWRRLPKRFKDRILAAYVPGQEITKDPSAEYLQVAMEVDRYVRENWKR